MDTDYAPLPPVDALPLIELVDHGLVALLGELHHEDWHRVAVKTWTVKDVVAHLVDGNLRRLSLDRDAWRSAAATGENDYRRLVDFLNRLNADWIKGCGPVESEGARRPRFLQQSGSERVLRHTRSGLARALPGSLGRPRGLAGLDGCGPRVHGEMASPTADTRRRQSTRFEGASILASTLGHVRACPTPILRRRRSRGWNHGRRHRGRSRIHLLALAAGARWVATL